MNKFRIEYKEEGGSGGLYELEKKHYFYVIDNQTNQVLKTYEGEYFASFEDGGWNNGYFTGVVKVELGEREDEVVVHYTYKIDIEKILD
jgi:hypothetical protein